MKTLASLSFFLCAAMIGYDGLSQTNYTIISNLGQPSNGSEYIGFYSTPNDSGQNGFAYVTFTNGNTASFLSSVSISMANAVTTDGALPPITVLFSEGGVYFGVSRSTVLAGNSYPTNAGIYTYTCTNTVPFGLAPKAVYSVQLFAQITNTDYSITAITNFYYWKTVSSPTVDAGSVGAISTFSLFGEPLVYPQFSVTVSPAVPPALSIFQPIILDFPDSGIPFVLQESTSLTSTNWKTATNAIQLQTVNSGQTVLLVPSSGTQKFFRLSLPQ